MRIVDSPIAQTTFSRDSGTDDDMKSLMMTNDEVLKRKEEKTAAMKKQQKSKKTFAKIAHAQCKRKRLTGRGGACQQVTLKR